MRLLILIAALLLVSLLPALAQQGTPMVLDDFEKPGLSAWSTSMSPEYYKGGTGQQRLY